LTEELAKQQEKLAELIQELLQLNEEDRERVIRIVKNNPTRKIMLAVHNAYKIDKKGRKKPIMSLEEFEKMLKRIRF